MDGWMGVGEQTERSLMEQGATCPLVLSANLLTSVVLFFSFGSAKEQRCRRRLADIRLLSAHWSSLFRVIRVFNIDIDGPSS